jgi:hypothetical protein
MTQKNNRVTDKSVVDVPADNPEGTMERFQDGLRRVLTVRKVDVRREVAHRPVAPKGAYNKRAGKA